MDATEESLQVVVRFPFRELHPLKQILEAHPCLQPALRAYARRDLRACAKELAQVIEDWSPATSSSLREREQVRVWLWFLARVTPPEEEDTLPSEGI